MIDKKEEISNGAPIERDWDSAISLLQRYGYELAKKNKEFEEFKNKRFQEEYEGKPMEISKNLILQIAQLNDEISILEDNMLNVARDFVNENVIWIKEGKRGQVKKTEDFQEMIEYLTKNRHDRYYELIGFCNSLAKRNKELWEEFDKYIDSLSVPYDSEEVRDGKKENDDSIDTFKNPLNSLDYWTLDK